MFRKVFQLILFLSLGCLPAGDAEAQAINEGASPIEQTETQTPQRLSDEKMKVIYEIATKASKEEMPLVKELGPLMIEADNLLASPSVDEGKYIKQRNRIDAMLLTLSQHKAKTALKMARSLTYEERKIMFGTPKTPKEIVENPDAPKPPVIVPNSEIQVPESFIKRTQQ